MRTPDSPALTESNPECSHANLRNILSHLQTALRRAGSQTLSPYLSITHQAMGLNPDAEIDFDLQIVARAYELARTDRSSRTLPDESASQPLLQSAVDCLRGDFWAGFLLGDAPALGELISGRLLVEPSQPGVVSVYTFTNEILREVVYAEVEDARCRYFHRRALEILEAAGLAPVAFCHSLVAGREALHISAVNEAIIHLELAHPFVQETSLPEIPDKAEQLAELEELYRKTDKPPYPNPSPDGLALGRERIKGRGDRRNRPGNVHDCFNLLMLHSFE